MSGVSLHPSDSRMNPHLKRWMLFVDGENISIRAKKIADSDGIVLKEGDCYLEDTFIWLPGIPAAMNIIDKDRLRVPLQDRAVRAHYYTSVTGADDKLKNVKQSLWNLGFDPSVFKKDRSDSKAKGVDIALTKDMLSHAFLNNYDVAVLVAGDGDYIPLVDEVKRLGKVVYVIFFEHPQSGLNPNLKLASDAFQPLDAIFKRCWSSAC